MLKKKRPKSVYKTRRYKVWRKRVFSRDGFRCKWCKAPHGTYIEAHHIKPKARYPRLIYQVNNGITLCKPCHRKVTGDEMSYIRFFRDMLNGSENKDKLPKKRFSSKQRTRNLKLLLK